MKICVLSDIHANLSSLLKVGQKCSGIDQVWFLGDLFDRGEDGPRTYNWFLHWFDKNPENKWLSGNHDRAAAWVADGMNPDDKRRKYFDSLNGGRELCERLASGIMPHYIRTASDKPADALFELENLSIYITHGFPHEEEEKRLMNYDIHNPPLGPNSSDIKSQITYLQSTPQLIIVGHSHYQTAWLYEDGKDSPENSWSEWIPGFGTSLMGSPRNPSEGCRETVLDFETKPEGSFLMLNPGSVGNPRGFESNNAHSFAQYLILDISKTRVSAQFHTIC